MKSLYAAIAFVAFYVYAIVGHAEGRCPPGMYPIDTPGVSACAPIPNYSQQQQVPQAAVPSGRWVLTWGAIVMDQDRGTVGQAVGARSERAALAEAKRDCAAIGGVKCEKVLTYENQCVALAAPFENGAPLAGTLSSTRGPTLEYVRSTAIADCSQRSGRACEVMYSICSRPVWVQ